MQDTHRPKTRPIHSNMVHTMLKMHFSAHVLRDLMHGAPFHDLNLDAAVGSLDMAVIDRVIQTHGLSPMKRYAEHVQTMAMLGDSHVGLLEWLLENRAALFDGWEIPGGITCKEDSPRTLHLLLKHVELWRNGRMTLSNEIYRMLVKTKDLTYASLYLKHRPDRPWTVARFCGKYGTSDLANEILAACEHYLRPGRLAEHPSSRPLYGKREETIYAACDMYYHAVAYNNLEVMHFLAEHCPNGVIHCETSLLSNDLFTKYLLQMKTAEEEEERGEGRRQVLEKAMEDLPILRERNKYILWLMGEQEEEGLTSEDADDLARRLACLGASAHPVFLRDRLACLERARA